MYSPERVASLNICQLAKAIMILKVQINDMEETVTFTEHYTNHKHEVITELTKTHTQLVEELRKRRNQPHEAAYLPAPKHANYAHQ
jgi:hypothetical protein